MGAIIALITVTLFGIGLLIYFHNADKAGTNRIVNQV